MQRLVEGLPELRIPVGKPESKTIPNPVAEEEVKRLTYIKETSGRIVWAYYLGRAVTANRLMPFDDGRWDTEFFRKNVQAVGDMVKEVQGSRLLMAGYNKGAIHELVARKIIFPPKVG